MGRISIIDDVITLLIANGYASLQGVDIFPYRFPVASPYGTPLNCIAVFPLNGREPDYCTSLVQNQPYAIDHKGFQIQVRHLVEKTAYDTAEAIRLALDFHPPTGYIQLRATRDQPSDFTNSDDLSTVNGPVFRFGISFTTDEIRST